MPNPITTAKGGKHEDFSRRTTDVCCHESLLHANTRSPQRRTAGISVFLIYGRNSDLSPAFRLWLQVFVTVNAVVHLLLFPCFHIIAQILPELITETLKIVQGDYTFAEQPEKNRLHL